MKRIMCYGDSNTWGHDPKDGEGLAVRYPEHVRWTSVMADLLGQGYCVQEEGMGGRTTVFEDPTAYGRNGFPYLEVAMRTCAPFDCVIFMLGTNDLKDLFRASAYTITTGMARLLRRCREILPLIRSEHAKIILAAPLIPTADGNGVYHYDLSALSTQKGEELRERYRVLAEQFDCAFFDVNALASPHPADGVHLTAEGHAVLGKALAEQVRQLLEQAEEETT